MDCHDSCALQRTGPYGSHLVPFAVVLDFVGYVDPLAFGSCYDGSVHTVMDSVCDAVLRERWRATPRQRQGVGLVRHRNRKDCGDDCADNRRYGTVEDSFEH